MEIIKHKNISAYDAEQGALTMTSFPVNLVTLPFIVSLISMKSERLNNTVLMVQFYMLVTFYMSISTIFLVAIIPLLYCKIVLNSWFIVVNGKRERFKN